MRAVMRGVEGSREASWRRVVLGLALMTCRAQVPTGSAPMGCERRGSEAATPLKCFTTPVSTARHKQRGGCEEKAWTMWCASLTASHGTGCKRGASQSLQP